MAKKKKNKKDAIALLVLGTAIGGFALFSSRGDNEQGNEVPGSGNGSGSSSSLPRGIANNNPLNIIISGLDWSGKVPIDKNTDGKFEQFYTPESGYRAAIKNMRWYVDNENRDTLKTIIERWNGIGLPSNNYIAYVSGKTGIGANAKIPREWFYNATKMWSIIKAMAEWENDPKNSDLIKYDQFYKGFQLA